MVASHAPHVKTRRRICRPPLARATRSSILDPRPETKIRHNVRRVASQRSCEGTQHCVGGWPVPDGSFWFPVKSLGVVVDGMEERAPAYWVHPRNHCSTNEDLLSTSVLVCTLRLARLHFSDATCLIEEMVVVDARDMPRTTLTQTKN